jgi:hypothetical protein
VTRLLVRCGDVLIVVFVILATVTLVHASAVGVSRDAVSVDIGTACSIVKGEPMVCR